MNDATTEFPGSTAGAAGASDLATGTQSGPTRPTRPGLEPHPVRIPSLAFGLGFIAAGVGGLVAGTDGDEIALWLFPLVLVVAGFAGLIAVVARLVRPDV